MAQPLPAKSNANANVGSESPTITRRQLVVYLTLTVALIGLLAVIMFTL